MPTIDYWIQIENRPWDVCPHGIDRMTGESIEQKLGVKPTDVQLKPGPAGTRTMFLPLNDGTVDQPDGTKRWKPIDALILRRYKPPQQPDQSDAWTVPDDRKVNPWDLNEPDPTDSGTMGTIPGPVIECNVGDSVVVHFRNMDMRSRTVVTIEQVCFDLPFGGKFCFPVPRVTTEPIEVEKRIHSLHPHGFVFAATSDGAYPLSPPDSTQPVAGPPGPNESAAWASVPGFRGTLKQGDRVPPGGTFTYSWDTIGWPATAGVWLYHDHSICDMENVELGAIGIIVIHNLADREQEVDIRDPNDPSRLDPAFLPGGSPNGLPTRTICFPFPPLPDGFPFREVGVLPGDLAGLGAIGAVEPEHGMEGMIESKMAEGAKPTEVEREIGAPMLTRTIRRGNVLLELDEKLKVIARFCFSHFRTPPTKALYLQLFHTLSGVPGKMMINGRTFLGNTPTMVAGPNTRMRFGVVGMGSDFHTFHIHGHRWIIPGPDGNTPSTIQNSAQVKAVSQFEDTKIFGPANSFVFTIDEGSGFLRASPPIGEWHMHCHVLNHMDMGMMGSLLVVNGGELAPPLSPLPVGVPCPEMSGMSSDPLMAATVRSTSDCTWRDDRSGTPETTIRVNGTVTWLASGCDDHTVVSDNVPPFSTLTPALNDPVPLVKKQFTAVGDYGYHCGIHGGNPVQRNGMWGIVHVIL